ncbi:MAG: hypothetical protein RLZZ297_964 [Chloroflexota bacterium]
MGILLVGAGVAWAFLFAPAAERTSTDPTVTPVAGATAVPTAAQQPTATSAVVVPTATPAPRFLAMTELVYAPGDDEAAIDAFVRAAGGELGDVTITVAGRSETFGRALLGQTLYYSVSPRLILALLEYQSDLVTQPSLPAERYQWALGNYGDDGKYAGFAAQIRWAVREVLYARRDLPTRPPLVYAGGVEVAAPAGLTDAQYVVARVLAPTIAPDRVEVALGQFLAVYERLYGPLSPQPPADPGPPTVRLRYPLRHISPITSFFDHGGPFLTRNTAAGVTTYWGHTETDMAFAYNGHDGWDYAAAPPDEALAAADGTVVFAGFADDNCDTLAVIVDHGADVRTLYWHLSDIAVSGGDVVQAGTVLGVIGESGCAKGPHLHFGVQYHGVGIDPYGWCGRDADPWHDHPAGSASHWMWADTPSPCGVIAAGDVLVDSDDPDRFTLTGLAGETSPSGVGQQSIFVAAQRGVDLLRSWRARPLEPVATARWQTTLPAPGRYRVLAYVPYALSGLIDSDMVAYQIIHRDGIAEQRVDMQQTANEWVDLGTYEFGTEGSVLLPLRDSYGGRSVWADAVLWQAVATEEP